MAETRVVNAASDLYYIGERVSLGGCSHSHRKGIVVCKEIVRDADNNETLTGLYLKLADGEVKLFKLAKWKKGSFLGYDSLGELLLASGYVESKGPQLIPEDQIVKVKPMPRGWLGDNFIRSCSSVG